MTGPSETDATVESVLIELASGGFVVSNTFQVTDLESPFGPIGWQVYLRNTRNTRTGAGRGGTMREALQDAQAKALQGPTNEIQRHTSFASRGEAPRTLYVPRAPRGPTLGDSASDESDESELF